MSTRPKPNPDEVRILRAVLYVQHLDQLESWRAQGFDEDAAYERVTAFMASPDREDRKALKAFLRDEEERVLEDGVAPDDPVLWAIEASVKWFRDPLDFVVLA